MKLKRSLMGQLLLHVSVGLVFLYTKDLQAEAQSELPTTRSQPSLSLNLTTVTTVTTVAPPPSPSSGKFISFNSIHHSDITLEVI
jgi:hypothetical protein